MQDPTAAPRTDIEPGGLEDPRLPLGAELLSRSTPEQLPDRVKVIAVLRRVIELLQRVDRASAEGEPSLRLAMDQAIHDVGVHANEHHAILRHDAELAELEREVVGRLLATFAR